MKPLFCYDKAVKEEILTGEEFIVDRIPQELSDAIDAETEKDIKRLNKEFGPPFALLCASYISFALTIAFLCISITELVEQGKFSLNTILSEYIWVVAVPVVLVALGFVFRHYSNKLFDKNDDSVEGLNQSNGDSLIEQANKCLKKPSHTESLEILNIQFKAKGDNVRIINEEENISTDSTFFDAYLENDCLNLINIKEKYAIPLESITGYSEVKRKTSIWWLEEENPDKEFLKKYNLKFINDNVVCKYIYSLNILKDGEEYCLYLTPYELEKAKEIIGKDLALQ